MGSVAVRDIVERTDHDVVVGDLRTGAADALASTLGRRIAVHRVDVEDDASLAAALSDADVVLNATYMRWNVRVTRAAIEAGTHLVDLGAYVADTAEQLAFDEQARAAGCRIVPGCGVAPGLTNLLARRGADRLDDVDRIAIYSYITHPITTSPGIVYTRFDASRGTSLVCRDGRLEERASFGDEEIVTFPSPYGPRRVHLVPHPEPLTLSRYLGARDVVFKVAYDEDDERLLRALLDLGFDDAEPFPMAAVEVVPRDFAAAFVGRRGLGDRPTVNVKRVVLEGTREGRRVRLVYDFAVERTRTSASSVVTGTVAAVATDLVARGGEAGVRPAEAAFDAAAFIEALDERGLSIAQTREP
jgi:lysine 6-dehydrogenase